MTDLLLFLILAVLVVQTIQTRFHNKAVIANLDALGEMLGDMLRELINKTGKDGRP